MLTLSDKFEHYQPLVLESPAAHFVLAPNESLSSAGARNLVTSVLLVAGLISSVALLNGLWPISAFVSLDALGVVAALSLFRRAQWHRVEEVLIERNAITVRRWSFRAPPSQETLPCYGMSVVKLYDPDYGCRHLVLRLRGQRFEIARDLSPAEREDFARAFVSQLCDHRVPIRTETI